MKLLSWGANTYGQLGHSVKSEQCILPLELKADNILDPNSVISIKGGGGHTLTLNKHGQVFGCGSNNKGQLGLQMKSEYLTFTCIELLKDYYITQLTCGWDSSLAVTKDGELLVWGNNSYCQLGLPKDQIPFTSIPIKLEIPKVKAVASGLRHSAVVTNNGRVLVFGNGKKGQLGLTDNDGKPIAEQQFPLEVPCLTNVCSISCGQRHTVVMTTEGRIFVWGDNKHGQLGMDPIIHPLIFTPKEIWPFPENLNPRCTLLSGWTHVAILTDNGNIINWGRNTYGQLGCHEYERSLCWKPQLMNIHNVKELAIGSEHNIAIHDTGQVVTWGWNEHGNCGTGTEEDIRVPTSVGININYFARLIGTGAGHSFVLVDS